MRLIVHANTANTVENRQEYRYRTPPMPKEHAGTIRALQKGQVWKMDGQYLRVTQVGKNLVHYKLLRTPDRRAAAVQMARQSEVLDFLNRRSATLLEGRQEI